MLEHDCALPWERRTLEDATMWVCPECGGRWVAETVPWESEGPTFEIQLDDWAVKATWGRLGPSRRSAL
jgi:hypothetical protein